MPCWTYRPDHNGECLACDEPLTEHPQAPGLADGLYRVTTSYLCAGFIVRSGVVVECAAILRKKLSYWRTVAERVAEAG